MHPCLNIYLYTRVHTYIKICIRVCIYYTYIHTYIIMNMHTCMCAYQHICMHAQLHSYTNVLAFALFSLLTLRYLTMGSKGDHLLHHHHSSSCCGFGSKMSKSANIFSRASCPVFAITPSISEG